MESVVIQLLCSFHLISRDLIHKEHFAEFHDWLPFSFFNNTCELIHCLVHAECISNNIFLVDMGMNSWLNFFYWISCMVFYVLYFLVWSLEWQIYAFAVFVWIEKLASFTCQSSTQIQCKKWKGNDGIIYFFLNFLIK